MALQTSGAISLNDIHVEAGGTTSTTASLNDSDIRALIDKGASVAMSFSEWYGAELYVSPSVQGNSYIVPTSTFSLRSGASFDYILESALKIDDGVNTSTVLTEYLANPDSGGPTSNGSDITSVSFTSAVGRDIVFTMMLENSGGTDYLTWYLAKTDSALIDLIDMSLYAVGTISYNYERDVDDANAPPPFDYTGFSDNTLAPRASGGGNRTIAISSSVGNTTDSQASVKIGPLAAGHFDGGNNTTADFKISGYTERTFNSVVSTFEQAYFINLST